MSLSPTLQNLSSYRNPLIWITTSMALKQTKRLMVRGWGGGFIFPLALNVVTPFLPFKPWISYELPCLAQEDHIHVEVRGWHERSSLTDGCPLLFPKVNSFTKASVLQFCWSSHSACAGNFLSLSSNAGLTTPHSWFFFMKVLGDLIATQAHQAPWLPRHLLTQGEYLMMSSRSYSEVFYKLFSKSLTLLLKY